jgi:hypothetical protein
LQVQLLQRQNNYPHTCMHSDQPGHWFEPMTGLGCWVSPSPYGLSQTQPPPKKENFLPKNISKKNL